MPICSWFSFQSFEQQRLDCRGNVDSKFRALIFMLGCLCGCSQFTGCGKKNAVENVVGESAGVEQKALSDPAKGQKIKEHDFGLVFPGANCKHRFTIENNSSVSWRISRFDTTCKCAVANSSAEEIAPGMAGNIDVEYTAGTTPGEDQKIIWVFFEGSSVEPVGLVVKATVRDRVEVTRKDVVIRTGPSNEEFEEQFDLINRSKNKLSKLRLISSEKWLLGDYAVLPSKDESQVFRIMALIDMGSLSAGDHRATLTVEGIQGEAGESRPFLLKTMPVSIHVLAEIESTPRNIFLGELTPGQTAKASVILQLLRSRKAASFTDEDIGISHALSDSLRFDLKQLSHSRWRLDIEYVAPESLGLVHETVRVSVRQFESGLEIPLDANVVSPGEKLEEE